MRISLALVFPVVAWLGCSTTTKSPTRDAAGAGGADGGSDQIDVGSSGDDGVTNAPDATAGADAIVKMDASLDVTTDAKQDAKPDATADAKPDATADAKPKQDLVVAADAIGTADVIPSDAGTIGKAGNPNGSCSAGVPAGGQPADTSNPATVVGSGTAASCTFGLLQAAVTKGGVITFNCGDGAVTIPVTATLNLPTTKDTVIDGGNKITLDGEMAVQILSFNSLNFRVNDSRLTLQHITFVNGKMTPTQAIPTAPAPCSQGWDDGEGGALYMRDGNLTVIDSIFMNNQAAPLGPDTGGGAIYVLGSKNGALIVGSTFTNNSASNAGAVGVLFAELDVYNSLFTNNTALGHGANTNDATMCSVMNNGQNEVGSGGNGGALYSDGGSSANIVLCGTAILNNSAGDGGFGGGVFFTSNDMTGTLSITDSTMTGNTGGHWTNVTSGNVTDVGTAVGTNAKSITVTNSTLQGYP